MTPTLTLPIYRSLACESGIHCTTCRDLSPAGREWRRSLAQFYETPEGLIDWPCPLGKAWGPGEPTDERQTAIPPRPTSVARPVAQATAEGAPAPAPQPAPSTGPGTLLSAMIAAATGINSYQCAACDSRRREMDGWGWVGVWKPSNLRQIYGWLKAECEARKIAVDRKMIWRAIAGALRQRGRE